MGHLDGVVCCHPSAAELPDTHLAGLFLHELGHVLAWNEYGRTEQPDADAAVRELLGVRIFYRGPLLLEWVSPARAKAVLSA